MRPAPWRLRWEAVYWSVTAVFVLCTGLFYYAPRFTPLRALLHGLSLEFEQNLATTWEGACFLFVALLALDRAGPAWREPPAWPWLGLSTLAAGLSLDELGSIHERADMLFEPIGLGTEMLALLPLAVPAVAIAAFTLWRFWRHGEPRRAARLILALTVLASAVLQEKLEHVFPTSPAAAPLRGMVEEGAEMVGVFVMLGLVLERGAPIGRALSMDTALARMRVPATLLALLALPVLSYVTAATRRMQRGRGVPAGWVPFALLAVVALAALALQRARRPGGVPPLIVGMGAALLSADSVIVFERLRNVRAIRSDSLQDTLLPSLLAVALLVPELRDGRGVVLLAALLALTPLYGSMATSYWGFALGAVQTLGLLLLLVGALRRARPPDA
jgi:hypothetical protein